MPEAGVDAYFRYRRQGCHYVETRHHLLSGRGKVCLNGGNARAMLPLEGRIPMVAGLGA